MAKTALDLVVTAQDKASAVINKVSQAISKASGVRGYSGKDTHGADPILGGAIRLTLALNAARGTMDLVAASVRIMRGDLDAANDAFGRLPLGIGALYRSTYDAIDAIGGYTDAMKKLDEQMAESTQHIAKIIKDSAAWRTRTGDARMSLYQGATASFRDVKIALAQEAGDEYQVDLLKAEQKYESGLDHAIDVYNRASEKFNDMPDQYQQTVKAEYKAWTDNLAVIRDAEIGSITAKRARDIDEAAAIRQAELERIEERAREDRLRAKELFERTLEQLADEQRRKQQREMSIYRLANVTDQPRLTGLRQAAIESGIVNQQVTYSKQTVDTLQKILGVSQEFLRRLGYQGVMPGVFE